MFYFFLKSNKVIYQLFLVIPFCFLSFSLHSYEISLSTELDDIFYLSRGFTGQSDELKIAFADSSKPRWVKLQKSMSLSELISVECGKLSNRVHTYFLTKSRELNSVVTYNLINKEGVVVAIPFCHKTNVNQSVKVKKGDTLVSLLERESGVYGIKSLTGTVTLNTGIPPEDIKPEDIRSLERKLGSKKKVFIPIKSEERLFIQQAGEMSPLEIIDTYPPERYEKAAAIQTQQKQHSPPNSDMKLEFFNSFRMSSSEVKDSCYDKNGVSRRWFDVGMLNQRLLKEIDYLNNIGLDTGTTNVGVIDTGFQSIGRDIFNERFFFANTWEQNYGEVNTDVDDNGFDFDVWGVNFEERNGRIEHFGIDKDYSGLKKSHGTQVGTLILGGPSFISQWPLKQVPLVKLVIVNFGTSDGNGIQDIEILPSAINYLKSRQSKVINLSMSSKEDYLILKNQILNNEEMLYVTASGNRNKGEDIENIDVYPAKYSGNQIVITNLITVGSYDLNLKRAHYSNFGNKVDVLGPGCSINTIDHNGDKVTLSGTSFSSAFVSFTASLINSLGNSLNLSPKKIRNRIISSSDLDVDLAKDTWSSGRLNIVKAISISHDVIDVKNTLSTLEKNLMFGKLDDVENLRKYCGNSQKRKYLNKIKKFVPYLDEGKVKYWAKPSGSISLIECDLINSELPIIFKDLDNDKLLEIKLKNINDITPKII